MIYSPKKLRVKPLPPLPILIPKSEITYLPFCWQTDISQMEKFPVVDQRALSEDPSEEGSGKGKTVIDHPNVLLLLNFLILVICLATARWTYFG